MTGCNCSPVIALLTDQVTFLKEQLAIHQNQTIALTNQVVADLLTTPRTIAQQRAAQAPAEPKERVPSSPAILRARMSDRPTVDDLKEYSARKDRAVVKDEPVAAAGLNPVRTEIESEFRTAEG